MDSWTAFLLGLVGSLHCAGMCGPLVIALPQAGRSGVTFLLGRLAFNLGRIVTYSALGIVFGALGKTLWLAGIQRWASIGLGLLLLAALVSSRKLGLGRPITALVGKTKTRMAAVLQRRSFASLCVLGLLNGLLPCGLVYVATAGATATGGVLSGAWYMALFGVGTVPMMLAIGLSGKLVPMNLRLHLRKAVPASVLVLAALLILRGLSLGIPYISPDLSAVRPACCAP